VLGNTPTQPVDFFLERAKSFAFCVKLQDDQGTAIDLTGSVIRMAMAPPRRVGGSTVYFTADNDTGVIGLSQFRLQTTDLDLQPGEYPYDITLVTPEQYALPLAKGTFTVGMNYEDYALYSIYDFADPDQWITFTIKNNATIKTVIKNAPGYGSVWVGNVPPPDGVGILTEAMKEAIRDTVATMLRAGANITLVTNDAGNTLTISSTGGGGGGGGTYPGVFPGPTTFPGGP
jgi:hypothetical protein